MLRESIYKNRKRLSVCATVSASINPLSSDRLRCCDRYIPCQRSLAVKPLNSRPAMSGSLSHRWSVRRMNNKPQSRLAIVPCMLYYRSFVCPVLSVTLAYCGQTVGWIKMKLGMEIRLDPGHIVRWEPSRLPKGARTVPKFSAHVYCGQTVAHLSYCWALVLHDISKLQFFE